MYKLRLGFMNATKGKLPKPGQKEINVWDLSNKFNHWYVRNFFYVVDYTQRESVGALGDATYKDINEWSNLIISRGRHLGGSFEDSPT